MRTVKLLLVAQLIASTSALAPPNNQQNQPRQQQTEISRRDALITSTTVATILLNGAMEAKAAETIDMDAINAARAKGPTSVGELIGGATGAGSTTSNDNREKVDMDKINAARSKAGNPITARSKMIVPNSDPGPLMGIRGGNKGKSVVKIPRVGYSLYKTPAEQAEKATSVALRSGILHIDVGTLYGSNGEVAKSLQKYLNIGISGLGLAKEEKPELLERLDAAYSAGSDKSVSTVSSGAPNSIAPAPDGSVGRRGRREQLFVSHKISNAEQSTDPVKVRRAVKNTIKELGCTYLDMVSIHSPLTDSERRLETYKTLLNLRDSGFVKTVGVCNYGLAALKEIAAADLELPAVNQLELSPFNAHKEIVDWCSSYGIAVSCGAWSRLSSADGPTEGWEAVSKIAAAKGMTKAQVLVRWSLQKGYICVPRSAAKAKVEKVAIAENSYGGVNQEAAYVLSKEEMDTLDSLDVGYKAGKLGRIDGWDASDIQGPDWDPTDFV